MELIGDLNKPQRKLTPPLVSLTRIKIIQIISALWIFVTFINPVNSSYHGTIYPIMLKAESLPSLHSFKEQIHKWTQWDLIPGYGLLAINLVLTEIMERTTFKKLDAS